MVDRKTCSFCGTDIEPGTGKMYVKKDGTRYHFCSNKCQKNMIGLKRVNRNVRWTSSFVKQPGPTPPGKKKAAKDASAKAEGAPKSPKKASKKGAGKKAAAPAEAPAE